MDDLHEAVAQALNVADLERAAGAVLDPATHAYFAGGAGDEVTLRESEEAYRRWRLRPRVAVDVSQVDTRAVVLGTEVSVPLLVAPVAFQRMVDPDGEVAMARAAARAGTAMCLSTLATARPSEVAKGVPEAKLWFQLYAFKDRAVTTALMEEAVAHGCKAIVVTLDSPQAGRRERDLREGFELPADLDVPSLSEAFGAETARDMRAVFGQVDESFDWDDLADLADRCAVPVVAKGVMTAEDAVRAADAGAQAVSISNHGGRQLDCVPPTIDVLPEVADAVGDRASILLDGGIRRGTDLAIALSLGADAAMVGRPALWGLAVGGVEGAERALELLSDEFELALTLLGATSPEALDESFVTESRTGYRHS